MACTDHAMTRAVTRWQSAVRRRVVIVLAFALVLTQALGALHRVVHLPDGQGAATAANVLFAATTHSSVTAEGAVAGWVAALFAGHERHHDCEAFDHISHADGPLGKTLAGSESPRPFPWVATYSAWHVAAQAQGFLARGPPRA